MVQYVRGAIHELETAKRLLSANGIDTSYLDTEIRGLRTYMEGITDDHDPDLQMVVLFLTQQHAYSGSANNPELKRHLRIESTEEVQRVLDGYVGKGILESYGRRSRHGSESTFYKLSSIGYELSLAALRERAEKDERNPRDINIMGIGLSPSALNPLVRNNITNLHDLFSRGIPYIAYPKARKEVTDKTAFYKERMT